MDRFNRIKVILADRDIGVGDFAELMDTHRVTASRWINNQAQPSIEKLYEIADKLKVPICDLLRKNDVI